VRVTDEIGRAAGRAGRGGGERGATREGRRAAREGRGEARAGVAISRRTEDDAFVADPPLRPVSQPLLARAGAFYSRGGGASRMLLCGEPNMRYTSTWRSMSPRSALAFAIAARASSPTRPEFLWNSSRSLRLTYLVSGGRGGKGGAASGASRDDSIGRARLGFRTDRAGEGRGDAATEDALSDVVVGELPRAPLHGPVQAQRLPGRHREGAVTSARGGVRIDVARNIIADVPTPARESIARRSDDQRARDAAMKSCTFIEKAATKTGRLRPPPSFRPLSLPSFRYTLRFSATPLIITHRS